MEYELLKCTANYNDNIKIQNGKISFCMIYGRPHVFILVEDDTTQIAYSYVPQSTYTHITDKYKNLDNYTYINGDDIGALFGYIPFVFSKSYIVDTWKLTDKFVRLQTKPVSEWQFERYDIFDTYNVFSIIPYFGITDCIGYSRHCYQKCDYTK